MRSAIVALLMGITVAVAAGSPDLLVAVRNGDHVQVQKVLQKELTMSDVAVRFNPYIGTSENISRNTFNSAYFKQLESALKGQVTFDQLLANVEKEVNAAIKEGMDRLK